MKIDWSEVFAGVGFFVGLAALMFFLLCLEQTIEPHPQTQTAGHAPARN